MKIRLMKFSDSAAVAALCQQLDFPATTVEIAQRFNHLLEYSHHKVWVAEAPNGTVVGWIHAFIAPSLFSEKTVEGGGLVVDQAYRRSRVGQMLTEVATQWAINQNCIWASLATQVKRQDAIAFYKAQGGVLLGIVNFYSKHLN